MSWADSLLDASFRGVRFDMINARDSLHRALARHAYPFKDGEDIEDLGAEVRSAQVTAVFWGDDYESRLQTFLAALDERGSGELIHPVFGSMPDTQVFLYQVNHDAENVDYCTVDIQFLQSGIGNPFFVRDWPLSKADIIFNQAQSLLDNAATLMESALQPLRAAQRQMAKAKGLAITALNMVTIFRSDISGFVSSTTDFINYPSAFISDLQSALSLKIGASKSSISDDTGSYATSPAVIMSDWRGTTAQAQTVAALPNDLVTGKTESPLEMPSNVTTDDIAELRVLVELVVAIQLAQEASELLSDSVLTTYLSPADIEQVTNDARQAVQNAIDGHRSVYEVAMQTVSSDNTALALQYEPIINGLKETALQLQLMASALINSKPPLIRRTVNAAGNLHLVAHLWYGDFSRAAELQLLNPTLRDPNNLKPGDVLNAFAE